MNQLLLSGVIFLLLTFVLGFIRVLRGPTPADCLLGAQLLGSVGVAILLLLSQCLEQDALLDVALLFAFLAAVSSVAFVAVTRKRILRAEGQDASSS